jgi:hypothetical protein
VNGSATVSEEALAGASAPAAPLSWLFSNNSDRGVRELRPDQRKTAYGLSANVVQFIGTHGLDNCGFLTITFGGVLTWREWGTVSRFRSGANADDACSGGASIITLVRGHRQPQGASARIRQEVRAPRMLVISKTENDADVVQAPRETPVNESHGIR